jgi:hypothetical protein
MRALELDKKSPRRRALVVVLALAIGLRAPSLAAQTRFEWPDTTVKVANYSIVDECLAAVSRVRAGSERREVLTLWRDTFPSDPAEALKPAPAPIRETAERCAARFVEPATNLDDFAPLLALYLAAARDSDAVGLIARRLAALPAKSAAARASVADTAVEKFLEAHPARVGAAEEILLHRARAATDRIERAATYYTLMQAADNAGDTTRARRAAKWLVALADSLTKAERESEAFEKLGGNGIGGRLVVYSAINQLTGLPTILDSLRKSTAAFVSLERGVWATVTGERPEAIPIPIGEHAPRLVADFWFPGDAAHAPRPTPGRVSLIFFVNHSDCITSGQTEDAQPACAFLLSELRRLSERFPALEITIVAQTRGFFMYLKPPPPAEEADLTRQWLEGVGLKGAVLGVTSTPFWRLPAPDERRINREVPNLTSYAFGKTWQGTMLLADQDGIIVMVQNRPELAQYIDILLHRQDGKH